MVKKKNSARESDECDIGALSPIVARRVLLQLLEKHPELKSAISSLAGGALKTLGFEDLTAEIEAAVKVEGRRVTHWLPKRSECHSAFLKEA
jgi:hypothetical protein